MQQLSGVKKASGYLFYNQFAALGIPLSPYKSSSTWTYETGVKAANFAQIFDVSMSLFYNDTSDEQLFTFNPIFGRMAVEAELETAAHVYEKLDIGANFALLHSEITSENLLVRDNEVPYSPKFSGFISSEGRWVHADFITNGSAFTRVKYSYTGKPCD